MENQKATDNSQLAGISFQPLSSEEQSHIAGGVSASIGKCPKGQLPDLDWGGKCMDEALAKSDNYSREAWGAGVTDEAIFDWAKTGASNIAGAVGGSVVGAFADLC